MPCERTLPATMSPGHRCRGWSQRDRDFHLTDGMHKAHKAKVRYSFGNLEAQSWSDRPPPKREGR